MKKFSIFIFILITGLCFCDPEDSNDETEKTSTLQVIIDNIPEVANGNDVYIHFYRTEGYFSYTAAHMITTVKNGSVNDYARRPDFNGPNYLSPDPYRFSDGTSGKIDIHIDITGNGEFYDDIDIVDLDREFVIKNDTVLSFDYIKLTTYWEI